MTERESQQLFQKKSVSDAFEVHLTCKTPLYGRKFVTQHN